MSQRSFKVRSEYIEQVKSAYKRRYARQEDLAKDAKVGADTVRKFLNGKSVERENFWQLCDCLELEWQAFAYLDNQSGNISPSPVNQESERATAIYQPSLETLQSSSLQSKQDLNFVGRESAIAHLNILINQGAKVILIQSPGGIGKTTLAKKYLREKFGESVLEFPIAKETKDIASVESLIEERLRQLDEEPGREFFVSLERLKQKLKTQAMGVLIDNLEPALDESGRFVEEHRRYVELLRVLADDAVKSVTLITSREPLGESVDFIPYPLPSLSESAWQEFFNNRGITTDTPALAEMHQAFGGNALAMKILCDPIQRYFNGDVAAYWQEHKSEDGLLTELAVENLIKEQFNRLQQIYLEAYRLLCRLGCYRYQDVPRVPIEGLFCLLWDVPEAQHRRVIQSLRDRSLVEFCNGEYWLHPVIRAEAIARLRASHHWEAANRKAAEFWTESIKTVETIEDVLTAFEAYYHCIEISDFELACNVILEERYNKWEEDEPLGASFYRLGLLRPMISNINHIINYINSGLSLGILYNLLGDLYWKSGNLHEAIKCHEKSENIASNALEGEQELGEKTIRLMRLKRVSFLNRGLCKLGLLEIEEAKKLFHKGHMFAEAKLNSFHIVDFYFCLSCCYSYLGSREEAYFFAKKAESNIIFVKKYAWSTGYRLLFLGLTYKKLGEIEKSFEMFRKAIAFAEESHYTQVKGKALDGLAQLYRINEEFETALSHHLEAIELLDKIGAKCDLAEAYYQLGLTYQKMSETEKIQENFDKAIQLFNEMEAPKQVEKVRRAMEAEG